MVDPWGGICNALNGTTSWWQVQQPYYVSTLNKVMTHFPPPALTSCPGGESINNKINFVNSEVVYLGSYYRDQQTGQQPFHVVYRPDNSVFASWTQNFTSNYNGSWWYYSINLPSSAPTGMWRYEITYNNQPPQATYFAVNTTGYSFIGNGDWNDINNWANASKPPATLPSGHEIIINPIVGGECVLNQPQQISVGGKIKVVTGKIFRTTGNLTIQ